MANGKQTTAAASGGATLGFEKKLWDMADALRNNMDAAEYKARRARADLPEVHLRRL